jgi:hypothetical protein
MIQTSKHLNFIKKIHPLACLPGGALLIIASGRLAHAIIAAGALVWVYCLSSLLINTGTKIFPRRGKSELFAFISSFMAAVYLLLLWLFSPFVALEAFFISSLVPMLYMASDLPKNFGNDVKPRDINIKRYRKHRRLKTLNIGHTISVSVFDALASGVMILLFALIREPLGYLSLSLPGGQSGIVLLFSFESNQFLPVYLIASSCGALLLLGYFLGLYRHIKIVRAAKENKE